MRSALVGSMQAAAIRTFLIADVRGYTRFTAEHGDEAASRLAKKFAEIAAEGVEAWGGALIELRGDEALAVFDSARQALRAAVELQSVFADETESEPALPLGVGIGLDAGEAVPVGDGYRGAALNLAARLCAIAGAGEVFASEGLIHLAGHVEGLEHTPLEPTTFKGYDTPIAAVRVTATAAHPSTALEPLPDLDGVQVSALPPQLDPVVPLAGREVELRWLQWHWRRARYGHGRALVLSGPPGIGKTRLSAELATRAHASGASVVYLPAGRMEGSDLEVLSQVTGPALVIVDDVDAASAIAARETESAGRALGGRPLLLVVTHRREASPAVIAMADRLSPPEQRRELGPLEADAVRAIAALYAGQAVDELPLSELVAESGGVPATVHQVASHWARSAATRRLGVSADRTAAGRRGLRVAEDALIGDVAALETARGRARLYAAEPIDEDDRAGSRTICPHKGLEAFEAADADYYFGRERLIAELIARFVGSTFLGLVGDSGSGKSSALRAGLLPALAEVCCPAARDGPTP